MTRRITTGQRKHRSPLPWLALIAFIAGSVILGFGWLADWFDTRRDTASDFTDAIEASAGKHPGFRRAHSKGVCVSGWFQGSPQGHALSIAPMFDGQKVPVLGRLSIGGADPHGADASARVRSMALQLTSADGQQWRMAMNSFPFFAVPTVDAFLAQTRAQAPDPATGKPDPEKMKAFVAANPSAQRFQRWAQQEPWSTSWANTVYNGVNAFVFHAVDGSTRAVRWHMQPQAPFEEMSAEQRAQADTDYLYEELRQRLQQGPLRWAMQVTVAGDGDDAADPSTPWPDSRPQVMAGTLELVSAEPQAEGACRDINFDPLVLPKGVTGSDDPILAARSAVYSVSFNRRQQEIAAGRAPEATSKEGGNGAMGEESRR